MAGMLETLTRELFNGLLEGAFVVSAEGVSIETQLIDCQLLPTGPDEGQREPFSIVFRGPLEPVLPQQVYEVKNDTIGSVEIFLVPIGPDKSGMRYEAVFT